ncbi:MAG: hypothetical protein FWE48_06815 [Coriobacteriia bacterium]|nr:hypothetical protein [Coriobacteriia bacterium]MCL2870716.1 hypothetical protein [Coriobacteriia bacterium]
MTKQRQAHPSKGHEATSCTSRDNTIVSTFLDLGEKHAIQEELGGNLRKKPRSWLEYWDDRQAIYQENKMEEIETYEPTAYERLMALVSYLAFFVPILTKDSQRSTFVSYHMKQSINLLITNLFFVTVYGLVIFLFSIYLPDGPSLLYILLSVFWLFPIYLTGKGIANSSRGDWEPLPLIGKNLIVK